MNDAALNKLAHFEQMHKDKIIQLRVLDNVGCECFAEYLFNVINKFLKYLYNKQNNFFYK
jgi:hypothetical protein